jgi:RNA polymerase sigma-70 factor (ECF subfamily)
LINSTNERDLITLIAGGSESAFEELYFIYSNRLLGFLIRLVKSEDVASELLQEVFVKVWKNRENIDPQQSFRSYVFRIAENCVYDFFRKAARDKKLQSALINSACEYSHIEESFLNKENEQLLQQAINSLPPKRRQVFQMVKMEDRSYEEVSRLLNISTSTINDHIVKATKSVLENLEQSHVVELGILSFGFLLGLLLRL